MYTFRTLLRRRMADNSLTGTAVAAGVGVKQQSVSDWQRGVSLPTLRRVAALAHVLDVPASEVSEAILNDKMAREESIEPVTGEVSPDRLTQIETRLQRLEDAVDVLLQAEQPAVRRA